MNSSLTYVTCLFDLSPFRRNYTKERNARHYIEYAKTFVLKVDCPLYIFTSSEYYLEIYEYRKSLNLLDKTYIHVINLFDLPLFKHTQLRDNYTKIKEYYDSINKWCTVKFIPEYIYLILSKFYFLKKGCVDNIFNTKAVAWIDIGINHREKIDPLELNVQILYDISKNIPTELCFSIFTEKDIPEKELLKQWISVSSGGFIIIPVNKHSELDKINEKIICSINKGYLVYDETILYSVYKDSNINCKTYMTSSNYDKILIDYLNK